MFVRLFGFLGRIFKDFQKGFGNFLDLAGRLDKADLQDIMKTMKETNVTRFKRSKGLTEIDRELNKKEQKEDN